MVVINWFHRDLVVLNPTLEHSYLMIVLDLSDGEPSEDIASGSREKVL